MSASIVHSKDMVWLLDPKETFAGPARLSVCPPATMQEISVHSW